MGYVIISLVALASLWALSEWFTDLKFREVHKRLLRLEAPRSPWDGPTLIVVQKKTPPPTTPAADVAPPDDSSE